MSEPTTPFAAIAKMDWDCIGADLDKEGCARLPALLGAAQAQALAAQVLDMAAQWRQASLVSVAPGHQKSWCLPLPLPPPLAAWRAALYEQLVPIANRWADSMGVHARYPATLATFLHDNRAAGQTAQLSSVSHLQAGDDEALHQPAAAPYAFPLQLVLLLSEPGTDFTGGEFVLTEQRPRRQSRPMVLPLHQGDGALLAVAQRPVNGSNGYYRVNLKHAISRVRSGARVGIDLLFHDGQEPDDG